MNTLFRFILSLISMSLFSSFLYAESKETSYFEQYANEVHYLDLAHVGNDVIENGILGKPPTKHSPERLADKKLRKQIVSHATREEKVRAADDPNSIFSFAVVLGDQFHLETLPKTAAFFQKVDEDLSLAEEAAKKTFRYPRPLHNFGYSYPSGYAMRAYVWATLLEEIFPKYKDALEQQATQEGLNRIILNKQYPSSVTAGKIYGTYLAAQLLTNPLFVQDWEVVKKEILAIVPTEPAPMPSTATDSSPSSEN